MRGKSKKFENRSLELDAIEVGKLKTSSRK